MLWLKSKKIHSFLAQNRKPKTLVALLSQNGGSIFGPLPPAEGSRGGGVLKLEPANF